MFKERKKMRKLFIALFLLAMVGFNAGNVFAQANGGSIAAMLMEAGGGGRTANVLGDVTGLYWSNPLDDLSKITDGDYSTSAEGSVTGDGTGNNVECSVRYNMGVVSDISIITIKLDMTGTPHGNMFIRVSQDGVLWTQLPGFQIGIDDSSLQKERTILCPYRIQYIEVVARTSYSDPLNMRIYELTVR